jgi:hypothetical protein
MKVGDLVTQGSRVIEIRKASKKQTASQMIGTVIAIHKLPEQMESSRNGDWSKLLGKNTADVLWSSGKLSENFAERSLEVVNGSR